MKLLVYIYSFVLLTVVSATLNPFSEEFIELINKKQTTWKAGKNFHLDTSISNIHKLLGVIPNKHNIRLPKRIHPERDDIPERFDAREAWPNCADIIGKIRDQGNCGSCWAFGAVEAISDRICIHSKAKIQVSISAEDLLECCPEELCGLGCKGGIPAGAWEFWNKRGIVTGGEYESNIGCKPYTVKPCNHYIGDLNSRCHEYVDTPKCTETCNDHYNKSFDKDIFFGRSYSLQTDARQMQLEILENGPIEVDFFVYEDILNYKSGVYQHVEGALLGGHAVKILGWGIENDKLYWLAANSWNTNWGDSGFFKILRGENHCFIESEAVAGLPLFT